MKALGPASWGLSKTLVAAHRGGARPRRRRCCADQYPYEASGTGIVGALMPRSAQVGGREAMMKRITGELRPEMRDEVKTNIARRGGAETLMISRYAPDPSFEGQRLSDAGRQGRHTRPKNTRCKLLEKGDASLVSFNMSEGRHRAHHAAAVDDDLHRRRPGADGRRASRTRAPTAPSRAS